MAFINHEPAGFMKINLFSNLPGLDSQAGMELDKIYILPQFKGKKIGKRLLDVAFDIAKHHKKEIFWLSVIDTKSPFDFSVLVEFLGDEQDGVSCWRCRWPDVAFLEVLLDIFAEYFFVFRVEVIDRHELRFLAFFQGYLVIPSAVLWYSCRQLSAEQVAEFSVRVWYFVLFYRLDFLSFLYS